VNLRHSSHLVTDYLPDSHMVGSHVPFTNHMLLGRTTPLNHAFSPVVSSSSSSLAPWAESLLISSRLWLAVAEFANALAWLPAVCSVGRQLAFQSVLEGHSRLAYLRVLPCNVARRVLRSLLRRNSPFEKSVSLAHPLFALAAFASLRPGWRCLSPAY